MSASVKSPVIVIAAGGTGGHIFPAIATGRALEELAPGAKIIYACGERPLEISLYERNGITPVIFPARQIRSGLSGKLMGVVAAGGNVFRALRWVRSVNADLVIGFGGYVAGPTVLGAKFAGRKTALHEANSVPGRTNRILGSMMNLTASHFETTLKHLGGKTKMAIGMPIRPLAAAETKGEARIALGLNPDLDTMLIMGGSQGAKFLYETILKQLPHLDAALDRPIQILWSTGEQHLDHLLSLADKVTFQNIKLHLVPFISDMGNALKAADLAVARSGASALAELTAFRVYTIYVPFPGAIYDHQTINAREAERFGLGKVIPEPDVEKLLRPYLLEALGKVRSGYTPQPPPSLDSNHAAARLAQELLKLLSYGNTTDR